MTLLLMSSLLLLSSCKPHPDLKKDMVQLDKALVNVWLAIEFDDMPRAREEFIPLMYTWYYFNKKYQPILAEDDDWQESLRMVNDWLYDMTMSLEWNDRYTAMIQIDHVLYDLMELRRRHNMEYYLDQVWGFQMAHLILKEATKDEVLQLINWKDYTFLVRYFNKEWRILKRQPIDRTVQTWDKEQLALFNAKEKQLDKLINDFNYQVTHKEIRRIKSSFGKIEPELLGLIMMFGDYEIEEKEHYAIKPLN